MNNQPFAIHPRWIICADKIDRILENHAVIVERSEITAIVPWPEGAERYSGIDVVELPEQALIPGLINAHTHQAMNLLRGFADDLPLMTWLQDHIWPAESRFVNAEFVADGTRLAIAESVRSGVTCFNDMYFFPNVVADVAAQMKIRASIGLITLDFPTAWATDADDYLAKGIELHQQLQHNPLLTTMLAPHAPYTVSAEPLRKIAALRDQHGIGVHMHVHETAAEVADFQKTHHMRPLAALAQHGLLNNQLAAVHMTQLTDEEIDNAAAQNINVLHCPESNLKLASGVAPVAKMIAAGINVAIGTDGAASNNDLDMIGEMRTAALSGKCAAADAAALPATQVLRMATINGAKALGIDEQTGSIETGKKADLTTIDFNKLELQPVFNPVSHIVYSANRSDVSNVWVAGTQLLDNGKLTMINETDIIANAQQWAQRISTGE